MANILILGGGFAGLIAAEDLAASLEIGKHQITLVSRSPEFVFYPALVQVAFGKFNPNDISFDLAKKLTRSGVRFVQGDVVGIDAELREAKIYGDDFDGKLHYDYLIVALGRRLATEKVRGYLEHAHHLLGVEAALKFGEAVRSFESGSIVVGMCPDARLPVPVCETAFALARKFASQIKKTEVSVTVVFPESIEKAFGGANLHSELESAFEKHGINCVSDFPIREITEHEVFADDGQSLKHDLLMLVPPFRGQVVLSRMGGEIADDSAYAKVNNLMQLDGLPRTYAVGDVVAFPGPKLAQMAVRQGKVAAENVISEIRGEIPNTRYYHEIATIIDEGSAETIYLHYGIWDGELYRLKKGKLWSWAKDIHDRYWQAVHS